MIFLGMTTINVLTKSIKGSAYVAHQLKHKPTGGTTHMLDQPCPVCNVNCQTTALVDLVTSFEVCRCEFCPDYAHLVERMWHRKCFIAVGGSCQGCCDDL